MSESFPGSQELLLICESKHTTVGGYRFRFYVLQRQLELAKNKQDGLIKSNGDHRGIIATADIVMSSLCEFVAGL